MPTAATTRPASPRKSRFPCRCAAGRETTPWSAAPATTSSAAATATTGWSAATATTSFWGGTAATASSAAVATTCSRAVPASTSSAAGRARIAPTNKPPADEEEHDQEADRGEPRVEPEGGVDAVGEGRHLGGEDRRRQAQPDRAAGDLEHVDDAAGEAGLRFVDGGHTRRGRGRVEAADPHPEDDHADDQRAVAGLGVDLREEERGDGDAGGAEGRQALGADPFVERPGDEGDEGEGREEWQHSDPGLERRVAQLLLHELRQVEERREEGRGHEEDREAGGAKALVAHHLAGDERVASGAPLDRYEGEDEQRRECQQADHLRVPPTPVVDLVQRDQQRHEADRERSDSAVVDPPLACLRLRDPDQEVGDGDREDRDRDVEEEDPAPA